MWLLTFYIQSMGIYLFIFGCLAVFNFSVLSLFDFFLIVRSLADSDEPTGDGPARVSIENQSPTDMYVLYSFVLTHLMTEK